ncbi:MAG TPA: MFS transporter [Ilumatobacteraceae bacterium]|nr:MFS transporter [Ilumatobacteraceae bacterium]
MSSTPLIAGKFRWDRLTYSSALGYALLVGGLSVGTVLGELRQQFHISGVIAAMHGSTFGFASLIAGICGIRVVDRLGRRQSLLVSAAAISAGITMLCLGPAWPVTLAGTALAGMGGALLVLVMPAIISDHHGEHRAAAFAAVNGAPGLAGVSFSLLVGGALALHWSWRPPYLILSAVIAGALTAVAWPVPVPESTRHSDFPLTHLRDRDVFVPFLHIINAVFGEFAIGVWAATYLKEIGHASGGLASALAGVFGVMMFASRVVMPSIIRVFGEATVTVSFITMGFGALVMCLAPGLLLRVVGLTIVGFGGAPLYPLTVDRLYMSAEHKIDSISLGAICILASGTAVTLGPLGMGVLADSIGLRWALLIVPAACALGAYTQRPMVVRREVAAALD